MSGLAEVFCCLAVGFFRGLQGGAAIFAAFAFGAEALVFFGELLPAAAELFGFDAVFACEAVQGAHAFV